MSKKMLIDAAHAEETRVVVVDGTRVEEFDFESQTRKQLRGNIYLAKVTRVEPSLQAAFVEYGGNRHGFLAFNEIHPDYYQIPVADREALMREVAEEDDDHHHGSASPQLDEDGEPIVRAVSDHDDDDMEEEVERRRRRLMKRYKIQEVIRRRQIMLVQVVKEERGNKGAALTTYLSLAGRYGVLMPNTARGGGISRKITTATDRKRLKTVVQALDVPQGMGLIVRTAGAKRTKLEIKRDYEYLMRLWENIRETTMSSVAPALIYEEEDLVKRAIRDLYDKDIDGIWVEGDAGFREARDFMRMLMPSQAKKIQQWREPTPLYVAHKVEDHLSQIYSPVVPLRSGGYLVINQTEALVAVDVNSGRATRERNIEATALKTNMEAAEEAARQLRLRDLAGLVVIDFIDMDEGKNNRAVEKKLKDCLKDDRARVQMGKISSFGLMEISRQRRRSGVLEATTHTCEHCEGVGRVRTVESSALTALRGIELEALRGGGEVILKVNRAVGLYILNEKRAYLAGLHQRHGLFVVVVIDELMHSGDFDIQRNGEAAPRPVPDYALPAPSIEPEDDFVAEEEEEDDEEIIDEDEEEGGEEVAQARAPREESEGRNGRDGRGRRRRRRGGRRDEGRDEERGDQEARAPSDDEEGENDTYDSELEGDDGDEDGPRRRRRRGRRGGRRMRDDSRPADSFTWTRPRVPFGDDAFVWHDVADLDGSQPRPANDAAPRPAREPRPEAAPVAASAEPVAATDTPRSRRGRGRRGGGAVEAAPVEAVAETAPVAVIAAEPASDMDVWVELPATEEAAKKPRRSRSRKKADSDAPVEEAVAETPAVEAPVETPVVEAAAEPAPAPARRSRAKAKAPVAETPAVADPVVEAVAEPEAPAAPAEPDPSEISGAAPAKPRRGWWRR
ncbi:Rne/Rng family ribonuclease [Caulobacter sp. NIBR2454]|uniref:Rne/Rng family ribonuclease n=1 Tax=Caulobacter sp. NIBR2454 TaxID=3015996 RepID=UPI0022B6EFE1|nr:ribonuclease E/G [Caulobacter sp. NIBR2454]